MEKILEGSLNHFEVPDLLTFLNLGRRTGVLVLERDDRESKLFFRDGRPVYATSTAEELRFGSLLIKFKKLDAVALDRVLQGRPMGRIGQALLQAKLVTEEELASFSRSRSPRSSSTPSNGGRGSSPSTTRSIRR
jgi:hypothetical protein